MKDFIVASLPWIIISLSLALILLNFKRVDSHKSQDKTYLSEGMCIGMCIGVALSSALDGNVGLGISLGMLFGEAIGLNIKKEK